MDEAAPPPEESTPTNKPLPGAKLEGLCYQLGVNFHPAIKLNRNKGFEFAAKLSHIIDPQNAQITDQAWMFGQQIGETAAGGLQIIIAQQQIQFNFDHAPQGLEWISERSSAVLRIFEAQFKPQLVLLASASTHGILPVDGDARNFLASKILHIKTQRLSELGRPLHLLGMRFFLPPYEVTAQGTKRKAKSVGGKDWGVEVRIESLMEDASKLFVEAAANWGEASKWDGNTIAKIVGHLDTVSDYVRDDLLKFLDKAATEEPL
jgi:hypothetical protein